MEISKANLQDIYPLSPMQQGMLFHALAEPNSDAYFEQMHYCIHGALNINIFEQSWQLLIDRHDVLRTVFIYKKKKQLLQMVLKKRLFHCQFEDIQSQTEQEQTQYITHFRQEDRQKGFDLSRDLLIRVTIFQTEPNDYQMIWSVHHIILDAWCFGIIYKELLTVYTALLQQKRVNLASAPKYSRYIKWLQAQDKQLSHTFWQDYIQGFDQATALYARAKKTESYCYGRYKLSFSVAHTALLNHFSQGQAVTLNTLIQTAWGILLSRHNRTNDVLFGVTVSGRPAEVPQIENSLGLFINTIPVRIKIDKQTSLSTLLSQVQADALAAKAHHYTSLAEIQAKSSLKQGLINHVLVFENTPSLVATDADVLMVTQMDMFEHPDYNLMVSINPGLQIECTFTYNQHCFSAPEIQRVAEQLYALLVAMVGKADSTVQQIDLLPYQQKNYVLEHLSHATTAQENTSFAELFQNQVRLIPNKSALICTDNSLSYAQLNQKVEQLAQSLVIQYGVQAEDRVALLLTRSSDLVISLLAILRAGAAYVPLDLNYPTERIAFILDHSQASVLISNISRDIYNVPVLNPSDVNVQGLKSVVLGLPKATQLAYLIYTSGSTGQPKGVMIEQGQLSAFLSNLDTHFTLNEADILLALTPISFDISILELLGSLSVGMQCVLASDAALKDPRQVLVLIEQQNISVLQTTPARLQWLLNAGGKAILTALRIIIVGGEALPDDLANNLKSLQKPIVFNVYGPTEATIWSSYKRLDKGMVNIGQALNQERLYLVTPDLQLQGIGMVGEIAIAGAGVGRGYWQDDARTAQSFIANPYHTGQRMYKTGDLGVWLENGDMQCLGRLDDQVKIRGYRIELGEIESRLLSIDGVTQSAVINRGSIESAIIVAFVVQSGSLSSELMMQQLAQWLPEFMLPSHLYTVDVLPLNQNGKVDKKVLQQQAGTLYTEQKTVRIARNPVEEQAVRMWQDVLQQPAIGIDDDFFALGGTSINAISLVLGLGEIYKQEIALSVFLANSTIAKLSQALLQTQNKMDLLNTATKPLNIFCFPPIAGFGAVFQKLASHFEQGFYSMDYRDDPDIVQKSLQAIKAVQPQGPYILLGYSAGGNFAYEIAKNLENQGETVTALLLIDSLCIQKEQTFSEQDMQSFIRLALQESNILYPQDLNGLQNNMRSYLNFILQHPQNKALNCNIHHLQAQNPSDFILNKIDFNLSWQAATTGEYQIYPSSGNHFQQLSSPFLEANILLIQRILSKL